MIGLELKEALKLVIALGEIADKSLQDGDFGFDDLLASGPVLFGMVGSLLKIDFRAIMQQLKELDEESKKELDVWFAEEFDISNDKLEGLIEMGMDIATDLHGIVAKSINFVKLVKGE